MVAANGAPETQSTPWLSVSALGESTFCRRAGLLSLETNVDMDVEPEPTNLDFALPYSIPELETSLHRSLNRLWQLAAAAVAALALAGYGLWRGENLVLLTAAAALCAVAAPISRRLEYISLLTKLRSVLLSDEPQTPDLTASVRQAVDWFAMLADDWTSVRTHEPLRDEELSLVGSPWRTLRRGGVTVPVFKIPQSDYDEPRIYPQHQIRMAAYCRLIETCEGCQSPCGIVLFGKTYRGVTLPYDDDARSRLEEALLTTRKTLLDSRDADQDPAPPAREFCRGCPWGAPREHRGATSEISRAGEPIPVYGSVAVNGRLYHSCCGDRFAWTPPHESASRLGLGT
jgi:hypothetical protein